MHSVWRAAIEGTSNPVKRQRDRAAGPIRLRARLDLPREASPSDRKHESEESHRWRSTRPSPRTRWASSRTIAADSGRSGSEPAHRVVGRRRPGDGSQDLLTDVLIERTGLKPWLHLLDVGCGQGCPAIRLAQATGGEVTAITVSADPVAASTRLTEERALGPGALRPEALRAEALRAGGRDGASRAALSRQPGGEPSGPEDHHRE
ncbi:class I SAM-dependent methyltransferase [Streptomyces ossamyceticus]|nr:class I SAM-dependent methyltransferase [Streptomyces ossamyceticus]